MDRLKFVEDSFLKNWKQPYPFKSFKSSLPQTLNGPFLNLCPKYTHQMKVLVVNDLLGTFYSYVMRN